MAIREDWMHDVRSACQRFQCRTWGADRWQFGQALRGLSASIPAPESSQEIDAVGDLLRNGLIEAGWTFHTTYHELRQTRSCAMSPLHMARRAWSWTPGNPRMAIRSWTERFLGEFDGTHPVSAAERAAMVLRVRFMKPLDLDALALEIGASRGALIRSFPEFYGMSCGEFVTRLRLAWFVDEVRKPDAIATRLAADAGYRKYHNLVDNLRLRTGYVPRDIRRLRDDDVRRILDGTLATWLRTTPRPDHLQS